LARIIFAVVALFHVVRIYTDWPVMIGDWSVPMLVSWIGFVVAGGLPILRWLSVQDQVQQGAVNFQAAAVVINEAQTPKFVHEEARA
jgi:hypothetical protein